MSKFSRIAFWQRPKPVQSTPTSASANPVLAEAPTQDVGPSSHTHATVAVDKVSATYRVKRDRKLVSMFGAQGRTKPL
jgi:hypothetical protein